MFRRECQTNIRCRKPGKSRRSTINSPTSSSNLKLASRDNMNFNQLAGHKNSEYASLLEPMSDHSMKEENELLNSVYLNLRGKWRHSYKMTGNTPSMSKWSIGK
jgi:hypothetical protein